jgi:hypothetical protein
MDVERIVARWGKALNVDAFVPSRKGDPRMREEWGRLQVQGASPHDAVAFMRMAFEIDVRHVVPTITTLTLVLHGVGDQICHVENTRWLARHLPNVKYVELPGENHIPFVDGDDILEEVREFLTGVREPEAPDRVLATVLFTDIVGSTDRARELGDRGWRNLVEHHHELVRRDLTRYRGREVDTAGDGFFATFDGPARAIRCVRSIVDDVGRIGLDPEPVCTQARSSWPARPFAASRCIPAHVSRPRQVPARCSSRRPSKTSSPARASSSRSAVRTSSKGSRASGGSTPSVADRAARAGVRVRRIRDEVVHVAGLRPDARKPAAERRVRLQVEAGLVGDVHVAV